MAASRKAFQTLGLLAPLGLLAASAVYAGTDPYVAAVQSGNPVGFYQFNETSGSVAYSTANNPTNGNGTIVGNTAFSTSGPLNPTGDPGRSSSYTFSGFGGQDVTVNNPFGSATGLTEELWFNTTNSGQGGPNPPGFYAAIGLIDAEVGGVANDLGVDFAGGNVFFGIGGGTGGGSNTSSDVTIQSTTSGYGDGSWHMVDATWTNAAGTNMNLYVDGQLVATGSGNTNPRNGPTQLNIGTGAGGGRNFDGSLSEVALYTTALSASQVAASYAAGIAPAAAPEPSSVAAMGLGILALGACAFKARKRSHAA